MLRLIFLIAVFFSLAGCARYPRPGTPGARMGDEIVVAGRLIHTGTPVVLWMDPGGYDAYRVERRFAPFEQSDWQTSQEQNPSLRTPNRYGLRRTEVSDEHLEEIRGGGWDFHLLTNVVDQFVLHFDAAGTSRQCFKVLHDLRCLSVHFMLDLDGTIYQTLDVKERAWHATTSNSRSIGIEIANIGAYSPDRAQALERWYGKDEKGTKVTIPERLQPAGIRTPGFVPRPAREERVRGEIQGRELVQYDLTPEQYEALVKLTAALCRTFPKIRCEYPRDERGELVRRKLADEELANYQGLIGHFHVQANKVDPGPAFDWEYVRRGALRHLNPPRSPRAASLE